MQRFLLLLVAILGLTQFLHAQEATPRYGFTAGKRLFYHRSHDVSDPVGNDTYLLTLDCEMGIEAVDAAGNATITLTMLADSLIERAVRNSNDGITIMHPKQQPKIRFIVSPLGEIRSATILQHSDEYLKLGEQVERFRVMADSTRAQLQGALWFPRLPHRFVGGIGRDTVVTRRELVPAGASAPTVRYDSTISTYRMTGRGAYAGVDCMRMAVNVRRVIPINDGRTIVTTSVGEIYLRAVDGMIVHTEQMTVSAHPDGAGTTSRNLQHLLAGS